MNAYPPPPEEVTVHGPLTRTPRVCVRGDLVQELLPNVKGPEFHNFVTSAHFVGRGTPRQLAMALGAGVSSRARNPSLQIYDADSRAYHEVGPGPRHAGRAARSAAGALHAGVTLTTKCLHATGRPVRLTGGRVCNIQATLRLFDPGLRLVLDLDMLRHALKYTVPRPIGNISLRVPYDVGAERERRTLACQVFRTGKVVMTGGSREAVYAAVAAHLARYLLHFVTPEADEARVARQPPAPPLAARWCDLFARDYTTTDS
jgi:hypothetical protein